jgi:hypothetical protein
MVIPNDVSEPSRGGTGSQADKNIICASDDYLTKNQQVLMIACIDEKGTSLAAASARLCPRVRSRPQAVAAQQRTACWRPSADSTPGVKTRQGEAPA